MPTRVIHPEPIPAIRDERAGESPHAGPTWRRRSVLLAGAALGVSAPPGLASESKFRFEDVVQAARKLATESFEPPPLAPEAWRELDHRATGAMRFDPRHALWRDEGDFEIQLFAAAGQYGEMVRLNEVRNGRVHRIEFDPTRFRLGFEGAKKLSANGAGHAGFRLHFPINTGALAEEFMTFLGASIFRLLGTGHRYGAAARGLAIDHGAQGGEEIPRFREFWIVKPAAQADSVSIYALLDSPGVTGAYRFDVSPGQHTRANVSLELFARKQLDKIGIAPMSSMHFKGENSQRRLDDPRREVHDSDGLMMCSSAGEWLWRPLVNRRELSVSTFAMNNPRGFGLVQRDRHFHNYGDLDHNFERRPGLWIEPRGNWGKGRLELVEIPSDSPSTDNVATYWIPAKAIMAGESASFTYSVVAFGQDPAWPPSAHVTTTLVGSAWTPGAPERMRPVRRFLVEFEGGTLASLDRHQPVKVVATTSSGKLLASRARRNSNNHGWRAVFDLDIGDDDLPAELRCFLTLRRHTLSETWTYLYTGKD